MATRSAARKTSRPKARRGGMKTRSMANKSTAKTSKKSDGIRKIAKRYRSRPLRSASRKRSIRSGVERFHNRIKRIKNDVSPRVRIQNRTVDLINSLLNDILRNVTFKARNNTHEYRKKTITYTDVYVAAMNLFGDSNKWIDKVMAKGEKKAEDYKY